MTNRDKRRNQAIKNAITALENSLKCTGRITTFDQLQFAINEAKRAQQILGIRG